jgi:preprotein translocase subunit SecE
VAKVAGSGGDKRGSRAARPSGPTPPRGQRGGARRFVRESWGELRKVQWPTRQQVAQGTLVVAVVTIFFAAFIAATDQVAVRLVEQLNNWINS